VTTAALDLRKVSKVFRGRVHALREVDLSVPRGAVFGLLGPNGAGKSTLVKILTTVVRPTRAEGSVLGRPLGTKSVLAKVGYLPEHHRFPPYLTGRQLIEFFGALAKTPRAVRRRRAAELLEVVGMRDWADRRVTTYSKGMQQRTGIAMALVNDPELVILDEPTDGVDPIGRRDIRDLLVRMRAEGRTVFLNSHLLSEVEMVCDSVAIMLQGRVVMQGSIEALTAHTRRYEIAFRGADDAGGLRLGDRELESAPHGDGRRLRIPQSTAEQVQPVIDELRRRGAVIVEIREVRESLEETFVRAVQDPTTGRAPPPGAAPSPAPGVARDERGGAP